MTRHTRFVPRALLLPCLLLGCGEVSATKGDTDGTLDLAGHCDPTDPDSPLVAHDADCDGTPTADDCDDRDAASTTRATDADCDSVLAADDCDDADPASTVRAEDADCDSVLAADDCDDDDPASTVRTEDADCDSVLAADDCDDDDPASTVLADDADCDGTVADDDCDDDDPASTVLADDADCDGVLPPDDCDDTDPTTFPGAVEDPLTFWTDPACDGDEQTLDLAFATLLGDVDHHGVGSAVASGGDVDDDGLDDLLIGGFSGTLSGSLSGSAYLILGSTLVAGTQAVTGGLTFLPAAAGDQLGAVSFVDDLDGDGLDEVLLGAPNAGGTGEAYLFLGSSLPSSGSVLVEDADYRFLGDTAGDGVGGAVANVGDLDGDGVPDLGIGARYLDTNGHNASGGVFLLLGSLLPAPPSDYPIGYANKQLRGETSLANAGAALGPAGDVDGDGLDDLIVGSYGHPGSPSIGLSAGRAYLVRGADIASGQYHNLSDAHVIFEGVAPGDQLGRSVAGLGDVDGDGLDDVAVGALSDDTSADHAGRVGIFHGASLTSPALLGIDDADAALTGHAAGDSAGSGLLALDDLDGDGAPELVVGAYGDDVGADNGGAVHLFRNADLPSTGTAPLSTSSLTLRGTAEDLFVGQALAAGDLNGDGLTDLIVGDSAHQDNLFPIGRVLVFLSGF